MSMTKRDFVVGAAAGLVGAGVVQAKQKFFPSRASRRAAAAAPEIKPEEAGRVSSYSQSGEDLVVAFLLEWIQKLDKPTYLDVGACYPTIHNNTYFFYLRGARGVLVEPNVDLIPALQQVRKEDTVLNIGIGVTDQTEADYYVTTNPALHTFSPEEAKQRQVVRVVKMPLVNINKVIARHFERTPDFISLDVEGLELAILTTFDFAKYRPKVFCVDTLVFGTTQCRQETLAFMASKGYVARAQTLPNTIFVEEKFLQKIA